MYITEDLNIGTQDCYGCRYIFDLESYCKHENQTARGGDKERKVCPTAIHGFPTFDDRDDRTYY